jgi:hypothetical protein
MVHDRPGIRARKRLIVIAMIILVGLGGALIRWVLQPKSNSANGATSTSQNGAGGTYARTTEVPSDWKKYSDTRYPFSISYPASWVPKSDTKVNPLLYDYEVAFASGKESPDAYAIIGVKKQSLKDVVSRYKADFFETGAVRPKLLSEKSLKIDGNEAVEIRYQQMLGSPEKQRSGDIERQYFISSGGNVYTPQPVYENGQPGGLNASQSLTLFESLKISSK